MSKFLPIGTKGELLNSDMIARIIPKEDGGCIILTKDGQHFHSEIDRQWTGTAGQRGIVLS